MRFAITREHQEFFDKNKFIECEGLLTDVQVAELKSHLSTLMKGNKVSNPEQLYLIGRDVWRNSSEVKKIVFNKGLAEIAAKLVNQSALRIGYDQVLSAFGQRVPQATDKKFINFFSSSHSLEGFSCLQGTVCSLLICLEPVDELTPGGSIPSQIGNGVFASPQANMDFSIFSRSSKGIYLLIVYATTNAVIIPCQDPNATELRMLGYSLSDRLNDKLNPIIFRESR